MHRIRGCEVLRTIFHLGWRGAGREHDASARHGQAAVRSEVGDDRSVKIKSLEAEQCKGAHCVDLGESFQTHIYLQNLASIQPYSPSSFRTPPVPSVFEDSPVSRRRRREAENEPCKVCQLSVTQSGSLLLFTCFL